LQLPSFHFSFPIGEVRRIGALADWLAGWLAEGTAAGHDKPVSAGEQR